ncbi:MAG: LytTR family DNA-binding domain-containing protein [Bacteroidota bacterium]
MKRTVLIVDDEEDARELLKVHLGRHPDFDLVGEASNGMDALHLIQKVQPDIVLLDIQMPEMNGVEVVEKTELCPVFIFVTAYDQFAVKAFELNALDYLLKPVSDKRFDQTISRVQSNFESIEKDNYKDLITQVASTLSDRQGYLQRFTYKVGLKTIYIPTDEVVMISSADQYVEIHTNNKKYLLRLSMDYLEEVLDPALFFRTHRSFMVKIANVSSIEQYEPRNFIVHLNSGLRAKLTRDRKDALDKLLTGR